MYASKVRGRGTPKRLGKLVRTPVIAPDGVIFMSSRSFEIGESIPYIPFEEGEEKPILQKFLAVNKRVLELHAKAITKSSERLTKTRFIHEVKKVAKNSNKSISVCKVNIPVELVRQINDLFQYEWRMITGYSKLLQQQAWKVHRRFRIDLEDLVSEGSMALVRALWTYARPDVKFITYAAWIIHRQLRMYASKDKPLSHLTVNDIKLQTMMRQKAREVNGPATFDELVEKMKLSPEQCVALERSLTKVIHESHLDNSNSVRRPEHGFSLFDLVGKKDDHSSLEIEEILSKIELTDWERSVVTACMQNSDKNGWQEEVARKNINPITGKRYSRRAPAIAMKRIREKILEVYSDAKVA